MGIFPIVSMLGKNKHDFLIFCRSSVSFHRNFTKIFFQLSFWLKICFKTISDNFHQKFVLKNDFLILALNGRLQAWKIEFLPKISYIPSKFSEFFFQLSFWLKMSFKTIPDNFHQKFVLETTFSILALNGRLQAWKIDFLPEIS